MSAVAPGTSSKAFWVPFGLCLFVGLLTRDSDSINQSIKHLLSSATVGLGVGGWAWIVAAIVKSQSPQSSAVYSIAVSNELSNFFANYNPDLIPQELRPMFDAMSERYLKNRSAFLNEAINLLRAIKQLVDKRVQGIEGI